VASPSNSSRLWASPAGPHRILQRRRGHRRNERRGEFDDILLYGRLFGVARVPQLRRIVEWTRGGRMILRSAERAQPTPRGCRWDEHDRLIQTWVDVCETLAAQIRQDITLAPGEVLVVDNYRCLHGVRRNEGRRTAYILRCRSQDVR
jgi:Taurine catabolism dioxygenase TauD, TfdA family